MRATHCANCSAELKAGNTPAFGSGKLNDGNELCTKCSIAVGKANSSMGSKLKKHSLEDIQNALKEKADGDSQKTKRLEEIKAMIQNLKLDNISSFFGRKEIKELPNILADNEIIDNIIQGTYNNGQGILVSTDRRLVFVDKGLLFGLKVEDFPLDKISSIQYETGIMWGKVKIHTTSNVASIEQVDKAAARKFGEFVRDKLSRPKETVAVQPQPQTAAQPNVLEQLEKLGQLKTAGILSEEEFAEQKKKLLEKL